MLTGTMLTRVESPGQVDDSSRLCPKIMLFEKSLQIIMELEKSLQIIMDWEKNSEGAASTIGKNLKGHRVAMWIAVMCMPPLFVLVSAGLACIVYDDEGIRGKDFLVRLPVVMLPGVYLAVVMLSMGQLALFLPQAPFAAWEALYGVGFKGIGTAVALISGAVVAIDQAWLCITWSFFLCVLIARLLAFWFRLTRRYGSS